MSGSGEATPPAEIDATLTAEAHLSSLVRRARLALAVEKYWPWLVGLYFGLRIGKKIKRYYFSLKRVIYLFFGCLRLMAVRKHQ